MFVKLLSHPPVSLSDHVKYVDTWQSLSNLLREVIEMITNTLEMANRNQLFMCVNVICQIFLELHFQ